MNAKKTTKVLKENKKTLLLGTIILISLGLLYYVLFINDQTALFGKKPPEQPVKKFTTLDKKLNEVVRSANAEETAKKAGLAVADKKVAALITLKDESFVFTSEYGSEQLRYGKYIQAFVKLNTLQKLAENPKIASITAPLKGSDTPPPYQN